MVHVSVHSLYQSRVHGNHQVILISPSIKQRIYYWRVKVPKEEAQSEEKVSVRDGLNKWLTKYSIDLDVDKIRQICKKISNNTNEVDTCFELFAMMNSGRLDNNELLQGLSIATGKTLEELVTLMK